MTEILAFLGTIAVVVITWALNESGRRVQAERERKEVLYHDLAGCLVLCKPSSSTEEIQEWGRELAHKCRLSWLYGSDDVIRRENKLLRVLTLINERRGNRVTPEMHEAMGMLMVAIRREIIGSGRTDLGVEDFKLFRFRVKGPGETVPPQILKRFDPPYRAEGD